jgi:outer membrane protein
MRRGRTWAAVMVALLATIARAATGQEASPSVMTLDQALAYARAHQPSLRAALARAESAASATGIPRSAWYPRPAVVAQALEGTTNNTTASYTAPSVLDLARIGATAAGATPSAPQYPSWSPYASTLVAIGFRQEIFDFGRIAAQSAVFDANADAERFHAQSEALDVDFAVREAFYAVEAAKAVLEAAEASYDRVKANRDLAAAGVHSGLRNPIDLTRADAETARLDVGRIRARGGVITAQGVFASVVGVPDLLLDATGEPSPPPLPPRIETALSEEQGRDPRILEADFRLRAQQAQTRAILWEILPNLELSTSLSGRAGGAPSTTTNTPIPSGDGWIPSVPNWDVSLGLTWQWFDEGTFVRREVSSRDEEARREDLESVKLQQKSAVEDAYTSSAVALQALPALELSVKAAKDNYAQADTRFRAGLGTAVELADAEAVRTEAEIELALGRFEYARARARLARALAELP